LVSVKATPNDIVANDTTQYVGDSLPHGNEAVQVVSTSVPTKIGDSNEARNSMRMLQ
jgi:hypothetical protein